MNSARVLIYFLLLNNISVICSDLAPSSSRFKDLVTSKLDIDTIPISSDSFRTFKKLVDHDGYSSSMNADEFNHIYTLEKMNRVSDFIIQKTGFIRANASSSIVLHWLSAALLATSKKNKAISQWRSIEHRSIDPSWKEVRKVLDQSDEDIAALHMKTMGFNTVADSLVIPDLVERIHGSQLYSHSFCDDHEARQEEHPLRNLKTVADNGLLITFDPQYKDALKKEFGAADRPLVELLKNKRFIEVSGLKNSKISQIVHDHFDHFLTFDLLQKEGIFERYKTFMFQVGSPHKTDIFSREGELIASVAYDFRYSNLPYFKQLAFFNYTDIKNQLLKAQLASPNQMHAFDILKTHESDDQFMERLPVVVCGVYTEIMQQRIKNGVIKLIGSDYKPIDCMQVMNPEYLALIIETYDCLHRNKDEYFKRLLNVQLMTESFLRGIATQEGAPTAMKITADNVAQFDSKSSGLNPETINWFKKNLGAISDRNIFH